MNVKKIARIAFIIGGALMLIGFVLPFIVLTFKTSEGGAVGIIGGADKFTLDLLLRNTLSGFPLCLTWLGGTVAVSSLFCIIFSKTVQKHCGVKTSVISLLLSAVGALGMVCFLLWLSMAAFDEISKYPIEYPFSVAVGCTALMVFICLIAFYCTARLQRGWTLKGFLIDVLTSILCFPAFFICISWFISLID